MAREGQLSGWGEVASLFVLRQSIFSKHRPTPDFTPLVAILYWSIFLKIFPENFMNEFEFHKFIDNN